MRTAKTIGLIIATLLISIQAFCIGIIIPERVEPHQTYKPLALIRQDVQVNIKNDVARTHITQVFYNPYPRQLEATYIFPVPPDAHVTDFVMYINGKPVRGEILEKGRARAIYEDIVRRMRDPALLEYYDWRLFKMRIFPIPPQGKQRIEIELVQVLKVDNNMVHFSFPMSKRDFSEVNTRDLKEWAFHVKIISDKKIRTVYSPAHKIDVNISDDHRSAEIEISPEELSEVATDVDIFYSYSTDTYGLNVLTYRPYDDEDGYFLLIINPGKPEASKEVIPKDIIFVLDTSGSMAGEKIKQAKQALSYCLDSLNPEDRFNIISFSSDVKPLAEELLPASEDNIRMAQKFVRQMQARGGTNINEALKTALAFGGDTGKKNNRVEEILFLTDGLPTVGVTDVGRILTNVEKQNRSSLRIFVFGVGYDVNTRLLDGIANRTRALATYIQPNEDIEVKVSSLYDKISHPVMTDLELDFGKIKVAEVYPKEMPDLFAGADVSVIGKYKTPGHTAITLRGRVRNKTKRFVYECTFPEQEKDNEFIEKLWATRKIGYLLDSIRQLGEADPEAEELREEVIRLSKKYGIVTPYTSYLVQEDKGEVRRVTSRPPALLRHKEGSRKLATLPKSMTPQPMMKSPTGKLAVQQSMEVARFKESLVLEKSEEEMNQRIIKGKTFINKQGVWVDSELREKGSRVVRIKYLSDAYFELLKIRPDLADFLKLGEHIKIQISSTIILEISDKGYETLTPELRKLIKKNK
ncbi:VWA domain-containing protein [Candidatus Sumerlaeota bacterium]|nr:VWA domain-containing protein [Candidatus Sumerlaeota bacterium]